MKILLKLWLFLLINFLFINSLYAHPLDISVSNISLKWNTINVTTYFHNFEVDYLFKSRWVNIIWVEDYYDNNSNVAIASSIPQINTYKSKNKNVKKSNSNSKKTF